MEFLTAKIRPLYFRYLVASFGSTIIVSIYGIVDAVVVGQYHGPDGTAALAVVSPIWNLVYGLGLLMGIGGSVLYGTLRGEDHGEQKRANGYFTAALIGMALAAAALWLAVIFFDEPMLRFFGGEEKLMPLARQYVFPVKFAVPSFMLSQLLAAFLRNDNDPALATKAVLFGGVFNIFGDYFFVFTLDMGITGAGVATVLGSVLSVLAMLTHFLRKENTLRLERPAKLPSMLKAICVTGFSAFFVDVAMGILATMINRQILAYLNTDALAVYGILINVGTFVTCCAYSVGQAAQPILSANFGAKLSGRIRETLRYAIGTAIFFGVLWTALVMLVPNVFVRIFMTPTAEILTIAPAILRSYGVGFLLLPFNVFSTYYFQALLRPRAAFAVSVGRGAVISGVLIYLLPAAAGADALWFAVPLTELLVAVCVAVLIRRDTRTPAERTAL